MCSSSSRTGAVEGLISLARQVRMSDGIDARFAGDTVRQGENLGEHLAQAGVPWETGLRLSRKVRLADLLSDARALRRWALEGRYDLFHCAMAHDCTLSLWAARGLREVRLVRAAQRAVDLERRWLLRRCDGVVVHSLAYRDRLLRFLPEERVAYVPGSVDGAQFSPGSAPDLRARWGVPADAPLAGIVARMKPDRGHRVLLQAFARACRDVPSAWLALVGRGEDEEPLKAYARELGLGGRAVFAGYLRGPGLLQAYRALDVAVWLREGNDGACRGVLEAMACGVPVVAGSEGAPGELAGDTGAVVAPDDSAALAGALARLLGDLALAKRLGAAARERALQFTPQRAAAGTLAFWRRIRDLPRA